MSDKETSIDDADPMAMMDSLSQDAGVSGDDLRAAAEDGKTLTLEIVGWDKTEDAHERECFMLYLAGNVFEGRQITQKYTPTQVKVLYKAFRDLAVHRLDKGMVFKWVLDLKPPGTEYARLRPVEVVE